MRSSRRQRPIVALVAALVLAACASTEEALIARGADPAYAAGYDDGCESGKAAAGGLFSEAAKDDDRYAAGTQYAQGWDAGFATCRRDMAAMVREARLRNPSKEK